MNLQQLVFLGILVAINIVFQRFSFGPATVKVGLGFLGSMLLAYFYGPWWGSLGAAATDLLSSAIFGQEGGFFLGFTFSAMLAVFIYGWFLYQKPIKLWRIAAATILVTIFVNMLLNTYWLHLMYGLNLKAAFAQRLLKELITPWFQILVAWLVLPAVGRIKTEKWLHKS
ncbi:MAG: folate family ECF transporter S component [Lactobacillus sp.]|nr:folate family ECF transporter S component [Lactobacillus sp.]MCH3905955.1 folate family ECF transporter S component [Lactobacillus sp.]MCI1883930.1 folate family ECF transporter S component [Lactobacillus sp.]MCI1943191.1 folate family ECF transporter S component [Lactobacillus sp.]